MTQFKVGMKVVCINDTNLENTYETPKAGVVYEILNMNNASCCNVLLLDIGIKFPAHNPPCECTSCGKLFKHGGVNSLFRAERFKPLETLEQKMGRVKIVYVTLPETIKKQALELIDNNS